MPGIRYIRLLVSDVHRVQTPNFAMVPADVPRIEQGSIPPNRTTLQYIEPPMGLYSVPPCDIQADWSRDDLPPPSPILLDFMYGAAIVKHWKCDRLGDMLEKRVKDDFSKVLTENPKCSAPEDDEPKVQPDDPMDPDWVPSGWKGKQKRRKTFSSDASAGLLDAMDDVLLLSMLLKGTTPRSMAAEREKQNKEKKLHSQEHGAEKVRQWLDSDASVSVFIKCLFPEGRINDLRWTDSSAVKPDYPESYSLWTMLCVLADGHGGTSKALDCRSDACMVSS